MQKFNIDVYQAECAVFFGDEASEAIAEVSEWLGIDVEDECYDILSGCDLAAFTAINDRRLAVWLPVGVNRSTVFHECYHAGCKLLDHIGASGDDEELNAHLFEFITENVLTIWEQQKSLAVVN